MRNLLVIVLVVAAVAGLTLITHFTSPPPPKAGAAGDPAAGTAAPTGPPLVFKDAEMLYDPASENILHRSFPGFFEVGNTVHWVSFWFHNPHPFPVRLAMRGRSCTSCTSAKAAILPPGFARDQAAAAASTALPWSPVPLPDVFSAIGYAATQNKLAWHVFDFDRPDDVFTVPPAGPDGPAVGVLGLGLEAKAADAPKMVSAVAEMAGPSGDGAYHEFKVTFAPRPPFDILPVLLPVGDLPEGVPPRAFDVFIYSSTRGPGELPPPVGRPGGDDPFLTIGKPVPLTAAETTTLARRISEETKSPLRVQSGYRIPVTVHREVPGRLPDIGNFERSAHFAAAGTNHTVQVQFRGRVTGLVKLEDGEKIDLGQYNSNYTTRKEVRVYTDRADLDLELDAARSTPTFAQYSLDPAPAEGARKRWTVKVVIPAKQGRKPAWEGVVFLRAKGKDGSQATVRLPVSGNGIGR